MISFVAYDAISTFFDICHCGGNCRDNHIKAGAPPLELTEKEKGFMRLRFEKITGNSKLPSKGKRLGVSGICCFSGKYCIIQFYWLLFTL